MSAVVVFLGTLDGQIFANPVEMRAEDREHHPVLHAKATCSQGEDAGPARLGRSRVQRTEFGDQ